MIKTPALLLACALLWPARAAAEPVEITLWHSYNGAEKSALEQVVALFEAETPDSKVLISAVPYDAYPDKLTAAIPRGHGPDVFIFAHDRVGGWAEGGQIQAIELYVDEDLLDRHDSACVFALAYGDSLYGLPLASKPLALYVRTDKVKTPPSNFDELLAAAKANTKPSEGRYGLIYGNIDLFFHTPLLFSLGGQIYEGADREKGIAGKINVVNAGVAHSFELARRLAKDEGVLPDDTSQTIASGMFSEGRTAMVVSGPWFRSEIDSKVPYTVVPLPAFPNGVPSSGFLTCEGVLLSAKTKHPKQAMALLRFISSDERAAALRMRVGGQPVTLRAAFDSVLPSLSPADQHIFGAFRQAFDHAVPSPSVPSMAAVWTPMNAALYKVIHQGLDAMAAAEEAQARIEASLGRGSR